MSFGEEGVVCRLRELAWSSEWRTFLEAVQQVWESPAIWILALVLIELHPSSRL